MHGKINSACKAHHLTSTCLSLVAIGRDSVSGAYFLRLAKPYGAKFLGELPRPCTKPVFTVLSANLWQEWVNVVEWFSVGSDKPSQPVLK